ncbi:hypothetical protein L8O12_04310 [Enterobacter kobei]|uniref:hypothetical protein n=1 Tax=Enterobacter kobei TaxID=208224 RepID=UPI0020058588|nr:hypothetical protein [Enterobacter kobei]MCK7154681.1 hypothetical protein [Enterobacter kobei]
MPTNFEQLETQIPAIKTLTLKTDETGFFIQEVLRFYSIAGTLLGIKINLGKTSNVDERYFTHILSRSLLEPFFIILYIFEDPSKMTSRYEEQINSFKNQYKKLMDDLQGPEWQNFMQGDGSTLEAADASWNKLPSLPDMRTLLSRLKNSSNKSLDYLYPLYRITSFDTHGRSLATIFEAAFQKQCNFPVLDVGAAIELIASQYLAILSELRANKLI